MQNIKEQSEHLLKIIREKRPRGEVYETTYDLRKSIRKLNPSETARIAQEKDDLYIEYKRKNGYKW